MNDGTPRDWAQGTAVQVYFPPEALRVLPPSRPGAAAPVSEEIEEELGAAPLEAGAG